MPSRPEQSKIIIFPQLNLTLRTTTEGAAAASEHIELAKQVYTRLYEEQPGSYDFNRRFMQDFGDPLTKSIQRMIRADVAPWIFVAAESLAIDTLRSLRRQTRRPNRWITNIDTRWDDFAYQVVQSVRKSTQY